jgi:hypothetical protein
LHRSRFLKFLAACKFAQTSSRLEEIRFLHDQRDDRTIFEHFALSDGRRFVFLGVVLGSIRDDDVPFYRLLFFDALDQNASLKSRTVIRSPLD